MGGVINLTGATVYLDTNVFVYAVEGFPEYQEFLKELFDRIERSEITAVTSELTLAEVLVKPLELGRHDIVAFYDEMLQTSDRLVVAPIEREILVNAAEYRATLNISLPDAIHVATAVNSGCSILLSNDRKLRAPESITIRGLE